MKTYIAVTDLDWYRYLSERPKIREANFWRPYGSRTFKVLQPGEPFIFKTKAPLNKMVGGGIFEGFVSLHISQAWEFFGEGNGVASAHDLIQRICKITGDSMEQVGDREIGCILLRELHFIPESQQLQTPSSFSANIVQGKSFQYPGDDPLIDTIVQQVLAPDETSPLAMGLFENLGPTHGEPRLVIPRLGQAGFKAIVQEAYVRRCAITNHKILPTLQAAHIIPVANGGQHRVDNGVLLRSDVHTLFDHGYLAIDQEYRLRVSSRLRSEFGNGDEFYSNEGHVISLPENHSSRPSLDFLNWHLQSIFR